MKRPYCSSTSHPSSTADEPERKRLLVEEVDDIASGHASISALQGQLSNTAISTPLASVVSSLEVTDFRCRNKKSHMAQAAPEAASLNVPSRSPDAKLSSEKPEARGVTQMGPLPASNEEMVTKTEVDPFRLDEASFFSSDTSENASSHTLKCISKAFKIAAAAVFFCWVFLTTLVYCLTPAKHFRPTTYWERYTAILAAVILLISLLTQCIPLFVRGWKQALSGVVVGVLVVQARSNVVLVKEYMSEKINEKSCFVCVAAYLHDSAFHYFYRLLPYSRIF